MLGVAVSGDASLDQGSVAGASLGRIRHSTGLVLKVDLATATIVHVSGGLQAWSRLVESTVNCRIHSVVEWSGKLRWHMIRTIIVRLVLATTRPRWWHSHGPMVLVLRQHCARLLHLRLFCVTIDGGRERRVPIDHLLGQGERLLGDHGRLALDHYGRLLNVGSAAQIDRVDCFGLVGDGALDVLRGDDRHRLDHANVILLVRRHCASRRPDRRGATLLDISARGGHRRRRFLDGALAATRLAVRPGRTFNNHAHFRAATRALLLSNSGRSVCHGLRYLSLLLLSGCRRLSFGRLLASRVVRLRCGRRRRSLFPPPQQLLHVLVVLLAEHPRSLLALQEQVVRRCDVIEAISFDFLLGLACVDIVVVDEHVHDFGVDGDGLLAQVDGGRVWRLVLADGVPGVVTDVRNRVSLGRVGVQNVTDQVLRLL